MTTHPDSTPRRPFTKACLQAFCIIVAAATLGLMVNALRSGGLELTRPGKTAPPTTDSGSRDGARLIELDAALEILKTGAAIFIDARSENDYRAGHIQTARNLTDRALDIWMPDFFNTTPPETVLIVYCGDPRCHLAEQLAARLYEFGYPNVHHMAAGWDGWLAAGYPAESGL